MGMLFFCTARGLANIIPVFIRTFSCRVIDHLDYPVVYISVCTSALNILYVCMRMLFVYQKTEVHSAYSWDSSVHERLSTKTVVSNHYWKQRTAIDPQQAVQDTHLATKFGSTLRQILFDSAGKENHTCLPNSGPYPEWKKIT